MDYNHLYILSSLLISCIVTAGIIPVIVKIARAKNIMDEPGLRKAHQKPVPTMGGLSIILGFYIGVFLIHHFYPFLEYASLLMGLIILLFTGLKDDILVSTPLSKLFMQIAAFSIFIFFGDIRITNLYGIFGITNLSDVTSIIFTLLLMILITNSINLIDGVDGLASGIGIIGLTFYAVWFYLAGNIPFAFIATCLTLLLLVFLYFNVFGDKYKIFMGDTGSMFLGALISVLTIRFVESNLMNSNGIFFNSSPAISFSLIALPLIDAAKVFIIRIIEKRSPIKPDKRHFHHNLLSMGLSHLSITLIAIAVCVAIFLLTLIFKQTNLLLLFFIITAFTTTIIMSVYFLAGKQST